MKKFVLAGLMTIIIGQAFTQVLQSNSGANNVNSNYFMDAYDVSGKPLTQVNKTNFDGTPLLNEEWAIGNVVMQTGTVYSGMELQFNLTDNQLYFKKNNEVYLFAFPVKEFNFAYKTEAKTKTALFRNGYPEIHKNNRNSFYQVLADGDNVQLLKYSYKTLTDNSSYTGPQRKIYTQWNELYLYDVKNDRLVSIKKGKTSLEKGLPQYVDRLRMLEQQKNFQFHSEAAMAELVKELNN